MNFKKITGVAFIITALCCVLSIGASAAILTISAPFSGEYQGYSSFDGYPVYDGLVTSKAATVKNLGSTAFQGRLNVMSVTPGSANAPIAIEHSSLSEAGIPLGDVAYVRYMYFYSGSGSFRPELVFKEKEFSLSAERKAYACQTLVSGEWAYITFNIAEYVSDYRLPDGTLPEMVFYPFGQTPASSLSENDKLYLNEIMIWSADSVAVIAARDEGTLVDTYPIYFTPGRADAVGENPETLYVEKGSTITLPENPYTLRGYTFKGWISSDGNTLYKPGDKVEIIHKSIALSRTTSRTFFVANWEINAELSKLPDIMVVPFGDYNDGSNGVMDESRVGVYAKRTLNYEFDNIKTSRYQFLPEGVGANNIITFDGWQWDSMPLDIAHYRYCAFVYYWDTDSTRNYRPVLSLLGNGTTDKALTKSIGFNGSSYLEKNKWAVCGFMIDFIDNNYSQYVRWDENTIVNQMHFNPFGTGTYARAKYMSEDDNLYIGSFIFFKDPPASAPIFNEGYLKGYEDGTFKPNEFITNAESASLLASALGATDEELESAKLRTTLYSDISAKNDWYYGAVVYLEERGILRPKKGDKFNGTASSSRSSLTNQILFALSGDTETEGINISKIPASKETGPVTRAEAVANINALLKRTVSSTGNKRAASRFLDVGASQWFYDDINLASMRTVLYESSSGSMGVAETPNADDAPAEETVGIPDKLIAEGKAYVESLDSRTNERIYQIKNTSSDYQVKPGGTIYYVSTTEGSDSSKGTSQESPRHVSTLNEVSNIATKPGDVILFKRGDIFRGTLTAKEGVTYSAYGYGDKPILTRSPAGIADRSKWTLVHSDSKTGAKIWKFADNHVDIGAINLVDSSGDILVAYKEIPSFYDGRFWVRGQVGVTEYDYKTELHHNYMYFHDAVYHVGDDGELVLGATVPTNSVGPVYLRCDEGNPGTVFADIHFNLKTNVISCGSANGVTVDNLCILYFGAHGVGAGTIHNLTVQNCEIGWGGGAIQYYKNENKGNVTRYGNGIEIYGGLVNYRIENCYVYEIYDAGITHQISSTSDGNVQMEGVYYHNNVLLNSTYNIEYFMSKNESKDENGKVAVRERMMSDVYFTDNIVRLAGYGWGVQRPDSAPSNIKGWSHNNFCTNYVIENNVFDRCLNLRSRDDYVIQVGASFENSAPYLKNNVFVQVPGRILMRYGKYTYYTELDSEEKTLNYFAGNGNKLYFYPEDRQLYTHHVFWED